MSFILLHNHNILPCVNHCVPIGLCHMHANIHDHREIDAFIVVGHEQLTFLHSLIFNVCSGSIARVYFLTAYFIYIVKIKHQINNYKVVTTMFDGSGRLLNNVIVCALMELVT